MKTANIPTLVAITSKPYGGEYTKRKMQAKDLYCWFNQAADDHPHVSIDCSYMNDPWSYFHVTFPCYKVDVSKSAPDAEVLEKVSYSVYFRIDNERDVVKRDPRESTTSTRNWKTPVRAIGNNWVTSQGRADMDRQAEAFAKQFFSSAFFQSAA